MEMRMTALCQVMPIDWLEAISQVRYRQVWLLLGLLLTPIAVEAGALAAWRFGMDAGGTRTFFIADGFLSHWQVWCAFAASAEVCVHLLGKLCPRPVCAAS